MEYLEAMNWAVTIDMAQNGNEEMKEMLAIENQNRAESGRPKVEEELKAIIAKGRQMAEDKNKER